MEIELIDPIPELVEKYKETINRAIKRGLITLQEWNSRFKYFRDNSGYSFIHYLEAVMFKLDIFLTLNPIMLKNKKELEKRFKVRITNPEDYLKLIQSGRK